MPTNEETKKKNAYFFFNMGSPPNLEWMAYELFPIKNILCIIFLVSEKKKYKIQWFEWMIAPWTASCELNIRFLNIV